MKLAKRIGYHPLYEMYQLAALDRPSSWTKLEAPFLHAMWEFDRNFELGLTDQGDNQNGKGEFFRALIVLLLENCSGKRLRGRGPVPGVIFTKHALDTSYPETGAVEVLIEAKAAGAPKSPRSPRQKNPLGRPGSADLDKRIKEAGLRAIDLKAEWAR